MMLTFSDRNGVQWITKVDRFKSNYTGLWPSRFANSCADPFVYFR